MKFPESVYVRGEGNKTETREMLQWTKRIRKSPLVRQVGEMAIEEAEDRKDQGKEVGSQVSQSFGETNQNKNRRVFLSGSDNKEVTTNKKETVQEEVLGRQGSVNCSWKTLFSLSRQV